MSVRANVLDVSFCRTRPSSGRTSRTRITAACSDLFSFGVSGTSNPTITVTKHLISNAADPAKFNLRIDGVTYAANVGDGGTTGAITVTPGTHTVSETGGINANIEQLPGSNRLF